MFINEFEKQAEALLIYRNLEVKRGRSGLPYRKWKKNNKKEELSR
jgi:hypothetical protein